MGKREQHVLKQRKMMVTHHSKTEGKVIWQEEELQRAMLREEESRWEVKTGRVIEKPSGARLRS